jgi:hypothetical protein
MHSAPATSGELIIIAAVVLLGLLTFFSIAGLPGHYHPEIRKRIDTLLNCLGAVSPPIEQETLRQLYAKRDFPQMLGWIKQSMRLDLRVGLRVVHESGDPPMWIESPTKMPPFGTAEFRRTRVIVNARLDVLYGRPFTWVVAGFAHELSHVVLFSINHPLQHDEKAVDLTAMILGFREFIARTEIRADQKKHTLGYLTAAESSYAYQYIAKRECKAGLRANI